MLFGFILLLNESHVTLHWKRWALPQLLHEPLLQPLVPHPLDQLQVCEIFPPLNTMLSEKPLQQILFKIF